MKKITTLAMTLATIGRASMFDQPIRRAIDPVMQRVAAPLVKWGVKADQVTYVGFLFGVSAMVAIANQAYGVGLALILLNRFCDGLDGDIARMTKPSDIGGYLDIVLDFLFYSGIVFAFGLSHPDHMNAAGFLLFSFVGTGTTFLTFAIFAEKHKLRPPKMENKAFVYLSGLTEGGETIAFFVLFSVFPGYFPAFAYVFGVLCWVTVLMRFRSAYIALTGPKGAEFRGDQ